MKKKVKKKRVKIKSLIFALIFLLIVGSLVYLVLNSRIRNIYVIGNSYYKEQDIIELAGLKEYPKRIKISSKKIKEKLLSDDLINDCDVNISLTNKVTIAVVENKPLFYDNVNNKIILSDGNRIDKIDVIGLPILTNTIDEDVYNRFIKAFNKVNSDVLNKISEISYAKTDLDKDRFLLYMNDQIYVYITLTKIDNLNNYNEIIEKLDGKKGILYLDSGNHFQVKDGNKEEIKEESITP